MTPNSYQQLHSKPADKRAFTLIELLIVITIIGILATMIFAGGSYAIQKARKTQAKNIAVGIVNACQNFESEYNRMPIPSGASLTGTPAPGDWEDGKTDSVFTKILTGQDNTLNKKEIDFLDGISPADGTPPVGGIDYIADEDNPVIYDPWGNFFVVHIDGNYDKKIKSPQDDETLYNLRVAVYSLGDPNSESPDKDVTSW